MKTTRRLLGLVTVILMWLPTQAQFTVQTTPTIQDLNTIHMVSASKAFAGGIAGTLLRTDNQGTTWTAVALATVQDVNGIQFVSATTGYGALDNGLVIKTTDGGTTWAFQATGATDNLRDIFFVNDNVGYAVGESGVIVNTMNGGTSWSTQTSGSTERLNSVYFTSATTGFAVGRNGVYLSTTDGGTTWALGSAGTTVDLKDIVFTDATTGYIARQNNFVQKTMDGGANWTAMPTNIGNAFDALYFFDNNNGRGVGNTGFMATTANGGVTWVIEASGTAVNLNDVHCFDMNNCMAAGDGGVITAMTAALGCIAPSGLNVTNVTGNSADLNWTTVDAANSYVIRGKEVSAASFVTINVAGGTTSSFSATGLVRGTDYEWQIQAVCGPNDSSPFSAMHIFTTSDCAVPAPISTSNITSTTATLNWTPVAEAQGYRISGREVGTLPLVTIVVVGGGMSSQNVSALIPNTSYEWSVQSICNIPGATRSSYAPTDVFATTLGSAAKSSIQPLGEDAFHVYPNPASSTVRVQLESQASSRIYVHNILGALVFEVESGGDSNVTIPVQDLPGGTYTVSVIDGETVQSKQLVIEH